ncbi:hypothetical protein [uncultured Marinococcus sp.]|uniref:hypothetical protein n=1 Tax=uncultured Marinococcus sp. TaxID=487012 RepID=UPI002619C674|nr:hypothetical protein [uncultured Marinococcus sp.]
MRKSSFKLNGILRITVFSLSIVIALLILIDPNLPSEMNYFPLVVLTFGICYLVFGKMSYYILNNIGILGLNITLIIRYVFTPFFMWLSGYSISNAVSPSVENYETAIILMIYEIIIIFLVVEILANKFYRKESNTNKINVNSNFVGSIFLAITILIVLIYPSVLSNYSFIFTFNKFDEGLTSNLPLGSLFPLMVSFSIMLFTVSIINKTYSSYLKKPSPVYIYFSILVVFTFSSFIEGTSRFSIVIPMVTGMYLITRIYPAFKYKIYSICGIILLGIVSITTLVKQFGVNSFNSINNSQINNIGEAIGDSLQLYFSGIHNVAVAVKTKENFSHIISPKMLIEDLSSSVILLSDQVASNFGVVEMFNYTFHNNTNSVDQIIPMIGQGYVYFGFFFSPLFVIIFTVLVMFFDKKSREAESVFEVYIFSYASVRFGLFLMSNAIVLTSFITNYFLLMLIIVLLNKKIIFIKKNMR